MHFLILETPALENYDMGVASGRRRDRLLQRQSRRHRGAWEGHHPNLATPDQSTTKWGGHRRLGPAVDWVIGFLGRCSGAPEAWHQRAWCHLMA